MTADVDAVIAGLLATPRRLPSCLLYDAAGAELFSRISRLDAYYPTRVETDLLACHLGDIAAAVGPRARVVEPGCGEGRKTELLLRGLDRPAACVPIDIAGDQLAAVAEALRGAVPGVEVHPVRADYTRAFDLPALVTPWSRTLVFFPGSTIGNFEPSEGCAFLARLARLAGKDRMLLLGADATRDVDRLLRAYDDEQGVTAAFDKNVLAHLNRRYGATFDVDAFDHRAVWNRSASRIEMHLVSACRQHVEVAGRSFGLDAGESIVTEHSYKHSHAVMQGLLAAAGWRTREVFTGDEVSFRLWLCDAVE